MSIRARSSSAGGSKPHWSCDLAIAPQGALDRIAAGINRRGRRAFGVLKTTNEYVGFIGQDEFEIWERQKRAIHARGRVAPKTRGTRLEVEFVAPLRTRVLIALFFAMYAVVSIGIATQPPDPEVSLFELVVAAAGGVALVALFIAGARSQRADLRAFLERTFADVRRI
jgi:hypothetical protein